MERVYELLRAVYKMVVGVFAAAIFSILIVMSFISTCWISSDNMEFTFFCKDNFIANIVFLIILTGILFSLYRKDVFEKLAQRLEDDKFFYKLKSGLLVAIFLISFFWVIISQVVPASDQLDVMSAAFDIRKGDYHSLEPGGYLERCNNQTGLVMLEYFIGAVIGDYNILGLQVINCIGIVFLYKKLIDIIVKCGCSRMVQLSTLICGIVFIPFHMYAAFVYGTIWSVALAFAAVDAQLRFIKGNRWIDLVWCAVLIGIAYEVKNNVIIILIAMIIYGCVLFIKDFKTLIRGIAICLGICLSFVFFNKLPEMFIYEKTGYKLEQGISPWAYVAMGLQDDGHAPGWSNGYNYTTYEELGYSRTAQSLQAKADITNSLAVYKANKRMAFEFFSQKIASMWTEPTYQSFWINQIRNHRVHYPKWLDDFMGTYGYSTASYFLGYFQLFLFVGSLLWLLLEDRNTFVNKSFFMLCIIGGFLFHLMWEAKSQYSITYVVMMIPMAIQGFGHFIRLLERLYTELASEKGCDGVGIKMILKSTNRLLLAVCLGVMLSYVAIYKYDGIGCLTGDDEYYDLYLSQMVMPYTNESVRDINIMHSEWQAYRDTLGL